MLINYKKLGIPDIKKYKELDEDNFNLKTYKKYELQFSKAILLERLYLIFSEMLAEQMYQEQNIVEDIYSMDNKIIKFIIESILKSELYTVEGISYYTHIPIEIINNAVYGINNRLSILSWVKIVNLYIQIKPEITKILIEKLLEFMTKENFNFSIIFEREINNKDWH